MVEEAEADTAAWLRANGYPDTEDNVDKLMNMMLDQWGCVLESFQEACYEEMLPDDCVMVYMQLGGESSNV